MWAYLHLSREKPSRGKHLSGLPGTLLAPPLDVHYSSFCPSNRCFRSPADSLTSRSPAPGRKGAYCAASFASIAALTLSGFDSVSRRLSVLVCAISLGRSSVAEQLCAAWSSLTGMAGSDCSGLQKERYLLYCPQFETRGGRRGFTVNRQ
jgi:hypothetical protein